MSHLARSPLEVVRGHEVSTSKHRVIRHAGNFALLGVGRTELDMQQQKEAIARRTLVRAARPIFTGEREPGSLVYTYSRIETHRHFEPTEESNTKATIDLTSSADQATLHVNGPRGEAEFTMYPCYRPASELNGVNLLIGINQEFHIQTDLLPHLDKVESYLAAAEALELALLQGAVVPPSYQ